MSWWKVLDPQIGGLGISGPIGGMGLSNITPNKKTGVNMPPFLVYHVTNSLGFV